MKIKTTVELCPRKQIWCGIIQGETKDGTPFLFASWEERRSTAYQKLIDQLKDLAARYDWIEL